ncbi:MTAP family purine nucleoside phosphorylase [Jiangella sp. DSM 45060]|uniref:MTAP family purine nucleoside phosphorylase n=1 Tax=Jiangella sp. DSM 45060 TaxID=1798224 RepID=UPI00087A71FF|nr:MTAP family purine nucleoside phosphorylase [Jiangella sp. DSM 45060]SDT14740.1 methylthioadenosine phosphorylase [Jiangella sp. DSM 45060]
MTPEIGIFGGSGFSTFLDGAETVPVETAWGPPSAPVTVAEIGGVGVAFLPRHGTRHELPPHRVNYRANVDAMRRLGVHTLVAPFAAGSLRPEIRPGDFVVVDQLVDRTWGRADTFHDHFDDGPRHVSLADPYTPRVRSVLLDAGRAAGATLHDGGTVVVINGPRFSTRAESAWHRRAGWHVVNMTQYPEAALAREAGLDFGGIALVTDHDAGLDGEPGAPPVSQEAVFEVVRTNVERVRSLLLAAVADLAVR